MIRGSVIAIVALCTSLGGNAWAQPDPTAAAGDGGEETDPAPALGPDPAASLSGKPAVEPASVAESAPGIAVPAEIEQIYENKLRHRLPSQLGLVIDAAFALAGFAGARQALPELWRVLRDDPALRSGFANLKLQYKPRLDYGGYVGAIAESTRYGGLAVGVEADLAAKLCTRPTVTI